MEGLQESCQRDRLTSPAGSLQKFFLKTVQEYTDQQAKGWVPLQGSSLPIFEIESTSLEADMKVLEVPELHYSISVCLIAQPGLSWLSSHFNKFPSPQKYIKTKS